MFFFTTENPYTKNFAVCNRTQPFVLARHLQKQKKQKNGTMLSASGDNLALDSWLARPLSYRSCVARLDLSVEIIHKLW